MNIFKIFDFFFWFCHPCRTPCEKERRSFSAVSGAKNIFKTKAKVRKSFMAAFPLVYSRSFFLPQFHSDSFEKRHH